MLVPVFLVAAASTTTGRTPRGGCWPSSLFAVASVTDRIDGEIARKRGLVTDFGKIADPIADKALIGAALIGLSLLGELPWWVTVVVLVREIGVTLLRFFVIRHGVMPASRGGKVKTLLQALGIGLLILPLGGVLDDVALLDHVRRRRRHRGDRRRLRRRARCGCGGPRSAPCSSGPGAPSSRDRPRSPARCTSCCCPRQQTLAVAESLTGGALGAALTAVPGVSATFRGGVIAYATELKARPARRRRRPAGERGPVRPGGRGRDGRRRPGSARRDVRPGDDRGRRPGPAGRAPAGRGARRPSAGTGRRPRRPAGPGRRPRRRCARRAVQAALALLRDALLADGNATR